MNREINYQFTPVPTKLFYLCDNNTKSVLFSLIQLSSHYAKEDGYFFRTNNNLEDDCGLSRKVIDAALDALYMRNIIDVIPSAKGQGKKQTGKKFKVNYDSFLEYEELEFEELSNPELKIKTPSTNTNYTPSFNKTLTQTLTPTLTPTLTQNANNINNIDNINNKENIYNKNNIYNINNILKEKENINIINNINIKEKESEVEVKVEDMEIKKEIKREIVEEIVSPANNGVNVLSSILVDWNGESLEDKNNITPTPKKSSEELERMMEEVIATSSGRDDELANFKMWVKLNKNDLNSAGLMGRAEEVFEILKNTSNKAILNPQTHQVEQVPTSKDDTVKTPKNTSYERCRKRTPSLPKIEVVDGQEYVCLGCGERIPVREGREEGIEIIDMLYEMEMANAC